MLEETVVKMCYSYFIQRNLLQH